MTTADQQILIKLDQIKAAQGGGAAGVTEVTGTAPIASSGGTTPAISIAAATTSDPGSMSAADKTKLDNAPADPQSAAQVAATIAASGGKLLDTTGAPDNGDGANGDWSFDNATKTIYGPKAAGVWPAGVVLAGSTPDNTAYGVAWDGSALAPNQDRLYDKIEAVVASIPAAHSGGVIGTAFFNEAVTDVTELDVTGIITSVVYMSAGRVEVTITEQPNAKYPVSVSQDTLDVTVSITNRTVTGFRVEHRNAISTNPTDADGVTVTVLKLSQ